jgi:hypothetical protein
MHEIGLYPSPGLDKQVHRAHDRMDQRTQNPLSLNHGVNETVSELARKANIDLYHRMNRYEMGCRTALTSCENTFLIAFDHCVPESCWIRLK